MHCSTGQPLDAVVRQSYGRTLWTWAHIEGRERRDALMRAGERLDGANATAVAFHEPKRLKDLARDHDIAVGRTASLAASRTPPMDLIAQTNRVLARMKDAKREATP